MIISKNSQNWIEIKFEIENVDFVRQKLMSARLARKKWSVVDGWVGGWVDGWVGGWMGVKAGLRIAYSNQ